MTIRCYRRPNRTKPRHFSERDAGRIVAMVRANGGNDELLLAYILEGYGLRAVSCALFRVLDILNTGVFLSAILAILSGMLSIVKGVKFILTKKRSVFSVVSHIIPKSWITSLGKFLLIAGSIELFLGAVIAFVSAIANNIELYLLMKGVCNAELKALPVDVRKPDIGGVDSDLDAFAEKLGVILSDFNENEG